MWMIALSLIAIQGAPPDSQVTLIATAIQHVTEEVGLSEYSLDLDRAEAGRAAVAESHLPMDSVARHLGVPTARGRDAIECAVPQPGSPRQYKLSHPTALVRIGRLARADEGFIVTVYVVSQWRNERLHTQMMELLLRRTPSGWEVAREVARGAS